MYDPSVQQNKELRCIAIASTIHESSDEKLILSHIHLSSLLQRQRRSRNEGRGVRLFGQLLSLDNSCSWNYCATLIWLIKSSASAISIIIILHLHLFSITKPPSRYNIILCLANLSALHPLTIRIQSTYKQSTLL